MKQLRGLGEVNAELKKRGGAIMAVSTDSPEEIKKGREKYPDLPVLFCSDADKSAIRKLGIVHETLGKELPAPCVILAEKGGTIRYAHYSAIISDRPAPELLLQEIAKLKEENPPEASE